MQCAKTKGIASNVIMYILDSYRVDAARARRQKVYFKLCHGYVIIFLIIRHLHMVKHSREKSVVLLSGGLDSAVAFKMAVDKTEVLLALTFDYGQRAARREAAAASAMSRIYGIRHETIKLPWLRKITGTALVKRGEALPALAPHELDDTRHKALESSRQVWVPNRNGIFINVAAAYCESMGASLIFAGFNAEEAATFPDNSRAFTEAVNSTLRFSTLNATTLISPTIDFDKAGIVRLGIDIGAPLDHLWSCYEGGDRMCGYCESCLRLKRALETANSDLAGKFFDPPVACGQDE